MSWILIALALAMQTAPTPPQQQPRLQDRPGPPQAESISPGHDLYFEESNRFASRTTPAARKALHDFAGCVARHSRSHAEITLRRDFTSNSYRNALIRLARNNETCQRRADSLSSTGLPFAGSLAEHLLSSDPTPLNVRLVRAAAQSAARPFSPTDRMALCVVRSVPDDISRLFATEIGSDAELQALRTLEVPMQVCARGGPRLVISPAGLRAMFATAAFRTLSGQAMAARTG